MTFSIRSLVLGAGKRKRIAMNGRGGVGIQKYNNFFGQRIDNYLMFSAIVKIEDCVALRNDVLYNNLTETRYLL